MEQKTRAPSLRAGPKQAGKIATSSQQGVMPVSAMTCLHRNEETPHSQRSPKSNLLTSQTTRASFLSREKRQRQK